VRLWQDGICGSGRFIGLKAERYFQLLFLTGMRQRDLRVTRWKDVRLDRSPAQVHVIRTHLERSRRDHHPKPVHLPRRAEALLSQMRSECPDELYLFPGRPSGGPMGDRRHEWQVVLNRIGHPDIQIAHLRAMRSRICPLSWTASGSWVGPMREQIERIFMGSPPPRTQAHHSGLISVVPATRT
jgi:integrase